MSAPDRIVLLDLDALEDRLAEEVGRATGEGYGVILIGKPTSPVGAVLDLIRAGLILGVLSRPLRHEDVAAVVERGRDETAPYLDLIRLVREEVILRSDEPR